MYVALTVLELTICRPGWPLTRRDPPAFAFWVLRLKVCATTQSVYFPLLKKKCEKQKAGYNPSEAEEGRHVDPRSFF